MSLPYYKRFPRDFLDGTIGLSLETKGAYAIVLDLIYMRDGRLPDDARYIAGQLGCSVRKWTAILSELVAAGKLQVASGIISNFRADYLTEESRKYQVKQAEIAGNPRKNKPLRQPEPSQSESEPEIREANASLSIARTGPTPTEVARGFAAFWAMYPKRVGKEAAAKSFAGAMKRVQSAEPLAVILAGLERALPGWDDPQYIPNPTTWLNQGRWEDDAPAPRTGSPRNAKPDKLAARHDNYAASWAGADGAAQVLAARRAF